MFLFLGFSIVAVISMAFWIIKFPVPLVDSIMFRLEGGGRGIVLSLGIWLFIAGLINGIVWLIRIANYK